jgi:hypothetical protein
LGIKARQLLFIAGRVRGQQLFIQCDVHRTGLLGRGWGTMGLHL